MSHVTYRVSYGTLAQEKVYNIYLHIDSLHHTLNQYRVQMVNQELLELLGLLDTL